LGLLRPAVVLSDNEYFENIRLGVKNIKEEMSIIDSDIIDKSELKVEIKNHKILDQHMTVADPKSLAIFLKSTPGLGKVSSFFIFRSFH
jgi:hypothetical protein